MMEQQMTANGGIQYILQQETDGSENLYPVSLAASESGTSLTYSTGQFNRTIIGSGDEVYIVSKAEGYENTVDSYGLLCAASGGYIFDTDVRGRGTVQIGNGGYAYNITLNSGAKLEVSSNAVTIDKLNILTGASASISGNVELQRVSVFAGATLYLSSGLVMDANFSYLTVSSGGCVSVCRGAKISRAEIEGNGVSCSIMSGGSIFSSYIRDQGKLYIYGGQAVLCRIAASGSMLVSKGGIAQNTFISNATMRVYSGGSALGAVVSNNGSMQIANGAWGSNLHCLSGGQISILNGGSAGGVYVNSGGNMDIYSNCVISSATISSGGCVKGFSFGDTITFSSMICSANQFTPFENVTIAAGVMTISPGDSEDDMIDQRLGAMVSSATIRASNVVGIKALEAANGGKVYLDDSVVYSVYASNGGKLYLTSAACFEANIGSGGLLTVSKGGGVVNMSIFSGGSVNITSAEVVSAWVYEGGIMTMSAGTVTSDVAVSGGYVFAAGSMSGGTVQHTGNLYIDSAGNGNGINVMNSGCMRVLKGGTVKNTGVTGSGRIIVSTGATAADTALSYFGQMTLSAGAIHSGTLQIDSSSIVSAYSGAVIDFTVSGRTASDGYLINDLSRISGNCSYTVTVSADQANGVYKLAQGAGFFNATVTIGNGTADYGSLTVNAKDFVHNNKTYSLDLNNGNLTLTVSDFVSPALAGDANGVTWNNITGSSFVVQYSKDNYTNILQIQTENNAVDTFGLPAGTYQWRVKGSGDFVNGDNIVSNKDTGSQQFISDVDGNMDVFFTNASGTWESGYAAEHQGFLNGWAGTKEQVSLTGKNKIADVFSGSDDANMLLLTDDANGDALFIEDIYTAFGKDAARFSQIDEIRAGAGDDIIDMTSQKFAYSGDEMTICGGLGDDIIWAAGGDNDLFGDAGNDRIIGSKGFDLIVGGSGNDTMHTGGGGNDIFAFGGNWGVDTVQLTDTDSFIALWFASGNESNWDAAKRIYRDGSNSVTVIGGAGCTIDLKFGNEDGQYNDMLSVGAFESAVSEKIFEDKNSGMLA